MPAPPPPIKCRTHHIGNCHLCRSRSAVEQVPREWRSALQKLAFMAETSGGTAGPDAGLIEAIAQAKELLARPYRFTPF